MTSPSADSPLPTALKPLRRRSPRAIWAWPMLWLVLLVGSSAVGLWAIALLTQIPPLPNCEEISRLSADSDRLYCAKSAAASKAPDHLVAAIGLVAPWRDRHPLYTEAEPLLNQWSSDLMNVARREVNQGHLETALALAGIIPEQAESYQKVQSSMSVWQAEWKTGEAVQAAIQEDIAAKNWQQASEKLQALKKLYTDYWVRQQFQALKDQIELESQGWQQLQQARELAESTDISDLGEAIALAQTIDLQSQAWREARADVDNWSESLLMYSFRQWELGNLDTAIETVQQVPADPTLVPEARDLIQFAQAQRLVSNLSGWKPQLSDLFNLGEAISAVQQIQPGSPFYDDAQAQLTPWQQELQDLVQLQSATWTANLGQLTTYRYAMEQAQVVSADRPRRQQAQTLVAHWQNQIQRIEDRPYLQRSAQLARVGTVAAYQAAIAAAQKVAPGRALRVEAQTQIASWTSQIQVIQDQPVLKKANTLAADGKLKEAIEVAQGIKPERALYEQAQTAIQNWTGQIQVAEDRPILAEAKELAYQGSLTAAINLASQIGSERALYPEARSAITNWRSERAYLESIEEAASPEDSWEEAPADEESSGW
ncbi:MAG: hypothetical protein HC886_12250 [Leptolyngbyaceae cyanobacterium SM1_1_3]|nr:hypothetical protein [Leptolyngbyaceae cyanobacterium SM1_1_3]NJN02216.1 hypothetical protein [Leptolyngbyaceae cyanobacterium RM1_1_2]NJO10364.1 hypothetical protein [Leptolyngbyaceae cyanobacterium SL_1_1]